jgi:hypothetical protein
MARCLLQIKPIDPPSMGFFIPPHSQAMPSSQLTIHLLATLALVLPQSKAHSNDFPPIQCQGRYPLHLQGICSDQNNALFWSWTDQLVKTDAAGQVLAKVPVANHHGDLCFLNGKVYVAVNLGQFNHPSGKEDSWVFIYDSHSLRELARHPVPELVHGAGGIATDGSRFIVVGGLPPSVNENYLYEYDLEFRFLQRHTLPSGHTDKGIQTATWAHQSWWFGCYGTPKILLRCDPQFQLSGHWEFDASLGIEALPDQRLLIGTNQKIKNEGHIGRTYHARPDPQRGLIPIP